jgi:hypothetical protein
LIAGRRIEEKCRALDSSAIAKDDLAQLPASAIEALDALFHDCDAIALQVSSFRC